MDKNSQQPTTNNQQQDSLPPVFPVPEDPIAPPMDMINPSPATNTPSTAPASSGSVTPTDDVVPSTVPTVINTSKPDSSVSGVKKKFAGGKGKIIATILGIFLLVGGVGAGFVLVRQNQNIQEQAAKNNKQCEDIGNPKARQACWAAEEAAQEAYDNSYTGPTTTTCPDGSATCASYDPNYALPNREGGYAREEVLNSQAGLDTNKAGAYCSGGSCPQEWDTDIAGYYPAPNGNYYPITPDFDYVDTTGEETVATSPPAIPQCNSVCTLDNQCLSSEVCYIPTGNSSGNCRNPQCLTESSCVCTTPTAMCQDVKAYDESWNQLTGAQLSQLIPDDEVRFCVAGSASSGTFDMARFTINGVLRPETTLRRPISGVDSDDFCEVYMIPEGVSNFTITAQIHHVSLGWK